MGKSEYRRGSGVSSLLPRLEGFVEERQDRPARVGELVRAAGVSARTLYRAFARRYGASPIAHIRHSRLLCVRRRLLSAGEGDTVTAAALDAGFAHLGRFAAHYERMFGERPSETLRHARSLRERATARGLRYSSA